MISIHSDNPTGIDLLGFQQVAEVVATLASGFNEAVTIGIHGPWGSGKSSVLKMIRTDLSWGDVHFVEINPWELDSQADVKGAVIGAVLASLDTLADRTTKAQIASLLRRVSWGRATAAIAQGALTMNWDIEKLIEAFSPKPEAGVPGTMAEFRAEFEAVLASLKKTHVVVLVDDLDRCMPPAVLATLEAIKLFLSVPKMVFVLAADQTLVREAIAIGLPDGRGTIFAQDYLDKIVQVPITLPYPTLDDVQSYISLLLHAAAGMSEDEVRLLADHAVGRRHAGEPPYLGGEAPCALNDAWLRLAQQAVAGLGGEEALNPRRVKRFMNALTIRQHLASAADAELEPAVFVKLFLLEHRFPTFFERLAGASLQDRDSLLAAVEQWAFEGDGDADPPDGVQAETRHLLSSMPRLVDLELDSYFSLARRLSNTRVSTHVNKSAEKVVRDILSDRTGSLDRGLVAFEALDTDDQNQVIDEVLQAADTAGRPKEAFSAALSLVAVRADMAERLAIVLKSRAEHVLAGHAQQIKDCSALAALASDLVEDGRLTEFAANVLKANGK